MSSFDSKTGMQRSFTWDRSSEIPSIVVIEETTTICCMLTQQVYFNLQTYDFPRMLRVWTELELIMMIKAALKTAHRPFCCRQRLWSDVEGLSICSDCLFAFWVSLLLLALLRASEAQCCCTLGLHEVATFLFAGHPVYSNMWFLDQLICTGLSSSKRMQAICWKTSCPIFKLGNNRKYQTKSMSKWIIRCSASLQGYYIVSCH